MSFRGVNTLACLVLHLGFKPWYNTYTYNTMSGWMSFWGGLAWIWYLGCCNIVCVGDMQGFIPSGFHHVSPFAFSHGSGVSGTSTTCWSSISAHFQLKPWTPSDCNPFPCGMRRELTASLKQLKMQRLWSGSRNSTRCADPTELETTNLRVLAKLTGWWSCWRNTTWMASSNGKFRIYHGFTTSDCKIKDIGHWRWPAGNSWWSGKFSKRFCPLGPLHDLHAICQSISRIVFGSVYPFEMCWLHLVATNSFPEFGQFVGPLEPWETRSRHGCLRLLWGLK